MECGLEVNLPAKVSKAYYKNLAIFWRCHSKILCCPSLTAVDCGSLVDPANGQVNHTAGTTFGLTAVYSCDTGYNPIGGSTRVCEATGVWSGSAPTCQRESILTTVLILIEPQSNGAGGEDMPCCFGSFLEDQTCQFEQALCMIKFLLSSTMH